MPGLLPLAICIGLFLLFPKASKYFVGTWVGFIAGGLLWGVLAACVPVLITLEAFIACSVLGIVGGCMLAAKG